MGLTPAAVSSEFTVLMVTCLCCLGSGRGDTQAMALGLRGDTSAHLDGLEKLLKGGANKVVSDMGTKDPTVPPLEQAAQAASPGSSTCEMPHGTPTPQQGGTSSGTESYCHAQGRGEAGPVPAAQGFGDHQALLGLGSANLALQWVKR